MPMQSCDHKSVGILVFRNGRLLLIDRARPPFGMAPPAGHVDDHGDPTSTEQEQFLAVAAAELREEVGLNAASLELVAEGRKDNACRRGGLWHYWRIYRAEAEGGVIPSVDEAKSYVWCSKAQMEEFFRDSKLESIWKEWFKELNILDSL